MKSAIYAPAGPAREYCSLAVNLYAGCTHGCLYCYVPLIVHKNRAEFHKSANPRLTVNEIVRAAESMRDNKQPIMLSFTSDPYQPAEEDYRRTRDAMLALRDNDLHFSVLTKGGELARQDFSLYRPGDSFGATLTFLDEQKSRQYEPGAAPPMERLENLMLAHDAGIKTWVSLEPVIDQFSTMACIIAAAPWVDHFKIGKLNYCPELAIPETMPWPRYLQEVMSIFRQKKAGFYIKKSLAGYIGHPEGYSEGLQLP